MAVGDIILGDGVFTVGNGTIGLNRGGGEFSIEREYREIEADGDYGPVKGRIRKIRSVAKLTLNALELHSGNLEKFLPASKMLGSQFTSAVEIDDATDYHNVFWLGKTKDGRQVKINLNNAINLDNIELEMADKEELVASVTFTATYEDGANRNVEPWYITWIED